ncbi:MAG: hypothetical protein LBE35_03580 [Clostridiales bacterium]|jgi:hypothetical protein|nr:hypothetical protein [Clostridiales bacterium]
MFCQVLPDAPPPAPERNESKNRMYTILGTAIALFVLAVVVLFFIFTRLGGTDFVGTVQNFAPWSEIGMNPTYEQVFNRFIVAPEWSEREIGEGAATVQMVGNLRETGERLAVIWNVSPHPTQRNYYYVNPQSITFAGALTADTFEMDDFLFFIFDAYMRGHLVFPMDEWIEALDELIDPDLIGIWAIVDATAAGWFVGGETLEFFEDGFGIERLGEQFWEFEWFADGEFLLMDYFEMALEYFYDVAGGELRLTDAEGNIIVFTRR